MEKLSNVSKEDLKKLSPQQLVDLKFEAEELLEDIEKLLKECKKIN